MRKSVVCPILAVALGAAGFALRKWELSTAFEPETGLVTPGMPSTIALIAVSAAAVLLFLLCAMGKHADFTGEFHQAFAAKGNTFFLSAAVLGAFLAFGGAALELASVAGSYREARAMALQGMGGNPFLAILLPVVLAGFSAAAGASVLMLARKCYRGETVERMSGGVLLPAYALCLWLIVAYQARASDPVIQDYIYELLAIICALLAAYYLAGFAFQRPRPGKTVFFALSGVYFSLVTLADRHDPATLLLYGFCVCYLLAFVTALLAQDGRPRPVQEPEGPRMPGEADQDNEIKLEGFLNESE